MSNTYTFTVTVESPTRLTKPQTANILSDLEDLLMSNTHHELDLYDSEVDIIEEEEED